MADVSVRGSAAEGRSRYEPRGAWRYGTAVRPACAALLLVLVAGCVSRGTTRSGGANIDQDRITEEELAVDPSLDLLTVVESLRPRWLSPRGRTFVGAVTVAVVVDGVPWQGGVNNLRTMRASEARELRHLSPADATTQFGSDMAGGAILVYRRR